MTFCAFSLKGAGDKLVLGVYRETPLVQLSCLHEEVDKRFEVKETHKIKVECQAFKLS